MGPHSGAGHGLSSPLSARIERDDFDELERQIRAFERDQEDREFDAAVDRLLDG